MHLAPKGGWGPQVTLEWPRVLRVSRAFRNTLKDVTGLVFQLCEPRPRRAGTQTEIVRARSTQEKVARLWRFRPFKYDRHRFSTFFTSHIATFQVSGFFAYKAFPPTVAICAL